MNILARRSVPVRRTVISLCSALLVGVFILVLRSGPAALAQASQNATGSAEDQKSRRELAADLSAAKNLIADLQTTIAKTNAVLAQSRADLDKVKADLAKAEADLKKANDDLVNSKAEVKSLTNAKVSIVFYNGTKIDNNNAYFHYEYTVGRLLNATETIPDICHVKWENKPGWSDHDDGIPRAITIHAKN